MRSISADSETRWPTLCVLGKHYIVIRKRAPPAVPLRNSKRRPAREHTLRAVLLPPPRVRDMDSSSHYLTESIKTYHYVKLHQNLAHGFQDIGGFYSKIRQYLSRS